MVRSFFLSQSQLSALTTCPRKYQYIYVDNLQTPVSVEQQRLRQWGSNFHELMQRQALGLPLPLEKDSGSHAEYDHKTDHETEGSNESLPTAQLHQSWLDLTASLSQLSHCEPQIFGADLQDVMLPDFFRQSEHSRSLRWPIISRVNSQNFENNDIASSHDRSWIFRVIYDRLVMESRSAEILDWKTYPQPKDLDFLRKNWQTRLYLFVLVETTAYSPEQVSMTYWFVRHRNEAGELCPQHHTFHYDRLSHEQTRQDLEIWIEKLTQWYDDYTQGIAFPKVAESSKKCKKCLFNVRCERSNKPTIPWDELLDWNALDL